MKTRIFSAALAAALVPALAACAAGGPASRGEASAGTATPQSAAADPAEAGSLQPLTPGTGQGYYVCGSNGGSPLLCYLDYASAAEVPLCARPNCEHNSESCTAWLPAGRMVSNLSAAGQGIAWIELDGIEGRVWLADADGAGRRQLPALPDGFAAETLAAQDGQALYCFASKYGEGQTTTALYRLPLDGGEAEQLLALPQPVPELKGVCGRSLVLYQYDWSGIEDIPRPEIPAGADEEEARRLNDEYQEQVAQVTGSHRVYLLDVDTGAEQELAGWTSRQGSSGRAILWQDDTLYWTADEDTGHIGWQTAAGETGQTAVRWPDTLPVGQGWYVTPERLVDGRLLVTAMDPDTIIVHRCAVDLQTGAVQELTLRYVENATEQPVRVLAQSGDMVLVRFESQVRDGLAGGDTEVQNRCGLISLEDFFAGRPNYREITLHYARDFS